MTHYLADGQKLFLRYYTTVLPWVSMGKSTVVAFMSLCFGYISTSHI